MKGVAQWFWIAAGVIGGIIIFIVAYRQIGEISKTTSEQRSLEQFNEIKNIADNLCWGTPGNKREYTVRLSEKIEGVYVAESKYDEYEAEKLMDTILSSEDATGKYLCIKVKDKRLKCEELECDVTMPFMGAVPEEFSLSALVNKLMGRGEIFDYPLEFERMVYKINVRVQSGCEKLPIEFNQIIKCDNKNIVILLNNLLVVGDSTFFVECCDMLSQPYETLLINSAKYFGGSKILIIWEDPNADPNAGEKSRLINELGKNGFIVESLHHDSKISAEKLKEYDQVWLIRPGICENPIMKEYCNYKWSDSEFEAFKDYLTKGKIVLITDYPSIVPTSVGDRIVKLANHNVTILKECVCGCDGKTTKADEVFHQEITKDVVNLFVKASAAFDMECAN